MTGETRSTALAPPTSSKVVLVAHQSPIVRGRFAAALDVARHQFRPAESDAAALAAVEDGAAPPSLAVVDLGLAADAVEFVRALRTRAHRPLAIVVFAGSVASADVVPPLAALGVSYINEHVAPPLILPSLAPHLFPDNFNRRGSARVRIGVPVSYRVGQTTAGATTVDIGRGGLAVRTMSPLATGTAIQVRFRLPASTDEIDAAGQVIWSDERAGMGIQFVHLSSHEQERLDAFVRREEQSGPQQG